MEEQAVGGADVIHADYGAFRTDGRCLRVIHLHQFQPCPPSGRQHGGLVRLLSISFAYFCPLGLTSPESGTARQIAEQDFFSYFLAFSMWKNGEG